MGNLVMGYWDCPFCGSKGIAGNVVNCPSCGRARGDVKFYMKNVAESETREAADRGDIEYLSEEQAKYVSKNPDWYCSFCNSLNSDNAQFCSNCGATRADSESNYFDMLKKKEEREQAELAAQPAPSPASRSKKPLLILLAIVLAVVGVVVFLNGNKTASDLQVSALSWSRTISVEKNTLCSESGWELPDGAELTEKKSEIHHYDSVLDRYVSRDVQRSRQVLDHYETYYTYSDKGNGAFEEVSHQRPVYKTEYYTETVKEPVYVQVPRYATKYYYTIWRWKANREAVASGGDHNAAWPDPALAEDERESGRSEKYSFTVEHTQKKNPPATYSLPEEEWRKISVGDHVFITAKRTGSKPYLSDEKGNKITDLEKVQ